MATATEQTYGGRSVPRTLKSYPRRPENVSISHQSHYTSAVSCDSHQANMSLAMRDIDAKGQLICEYTEDDPKEWDEDEISLLSFSSTSTFTIEDLLRERIASMAASQISLPLPVLPQGWAGENDFKAIGQLTAATQRNLEPVGPQFLAHARRV